MIDARVFFILLFGVASTFFAVVVGLLNMVIRHFIARLNH